MNMFLNYFKISFPALLMLIFSCEAPEKEVYDCQDKIQLSNKQLTLAIEKWGGHYTYLKHEKESINPLTWELTQEQMPPNNRSGAPFKGHFLCTGRWGAPSEGEIKAGIPHNGTLSNTCWTIEFSGQDSVIMQNFAEDEQLKVERTIRMVDGMPMFVVKEVFTNELNIGRMNNIVQHVTIGPPFLSKKLKLYSNAGPGFNQKFSFPNPEKQEYHWPDALLDTTSGENIDISLTHGRHNYVSTHIFEEELNYGFIIAHNPESGLALGYIWKTADYPWLNIWQQTSDGEPVAKGLEFGTTGIGQPYEELLKHDTRFHGHQSFFYHDAGEKVSKEFMVFFLSVNDGDFDHIEINDQEIRLGEIVLTNYLK